MFITCHGCVLSLCQLKKWWWWQCGYWLRTIRIGSTDKNREWQQMPSNPIGETYQAYAIASRQPRVGRLLSTGLWRMAIGVFFVWLMGRFATGVAWQQPVIEHFLTETHLFEQRRVPVNGTLRCRSRSTRQSRSSCDVQTDLFILLIYFHELSWLGKFCRHSTEFRREICEMCDRKVAGECFMQQFLTNIWCGLWFYLRQPVLCPHSR